jgi:hypothetical protein
MTPESFADRIMPIPFSGCWIWMGSVADKRGYGLVYRSDNKTRTGAHRYSWELHHGEIPAGMRVCHKCDIPSCVNPDHLFLGTDVDNIQDAITKGRANFGRHHRDKTHCPQGHEYTGQNLILYQGRRYCRACGRKQNSYANQRARNARRSHSC